MISGPATSAKRDQTECKWLRVGSSPPFDLFTMIETKRLRIRLFREDDLDRLDEIHSDAETMRYMGHARTRDQTHEKIRAYIDDFPRNGFTMWALERKNDGYLVGRAGLSFLDGTEEIEIGYLIDKRFWGQGLASEAATACVSFGFESVGLEWIAGIAQPPNRASLRILEKLGFVYLRDAHYYDADVLYHRLERSAWAGATGEDSNRL